MFLIPHSDMPAPGIPYDWSILTVYVDHINMLGFTRAETKQKHSEGVDTLLYNTFRQLTYVILTRETAFLEVGGLRYL